MTYSYNSYYFATPATAQIVANMLGGTVVASDAILGADPLAVTPADGFRVIRLLELARAKFPEARTP